MHRGPPENTFEKARRASQLALVVVGLAFLAWLIFRGFRVGDLPNSDFFDFYYGAQALRTGDDLYRVNDGGYIYPPLLAVVLRPITFLQPATAAHAWTILLAALLAACSWLMADETQRRLRLDFAPIQTAALASLATILMGLTWKSEFQWSNSNLLVLLPTILALRWVGRRPLLCGFALAAAVSIKYLPIVFLPHLLLRRRWTEATAFVVAIILLLVLPALVLGWDTNLRYLSVAFRGLLEMLGAVPKSDGANIHNVASGYSISLTSAIARWAREHEMSSTTALTCTAAIALVGFGIAKLIYHQAGVPMLVRVANEKPHRASEQTWTLIEWCCLLAAALLFSPQTQHRHLNLLMPLVTTAIALAAMQHGRRRWFLIAALALATLGATAIPGIPGWRDAIEKWNQGGGAAACVALLVLVTLQAGLRSSRESNFPVA